MIFCPRLRHRQAQAQARAQAALAARWPGRSKPLIAALLALGIAAPWASHASDADADAAATPAPLRNAGPLQLAPGQAPLPETTLRVQRYEVVGNSLLPAADIDALLVPLQGERALSALTAAAAAVQQFYRDAGYGGVVAFLPEQALASGVVRIQVVEGKLESMQITGEQRFRAAQMRAALSALVDGQTPRLRDIDSQIQLLNENPARQVRVLLQPGKAVGGVVANVEVQEGDVQRWSTRLDNTGSARTGRWRAALGWQHADVLAREHVAGVELQTSPENPHGVAVVSGNYRLPLYAHSAMFDAYAAWSDVDGGRSASAAGDVLFSGRGHIAGVRLQRLLPRQGEVDQRLTLGLEHRATLNNCRIDGLPDGACGSAGASVTVQALSLSYLAQSASGSGLRWNLHAGLHHNLALAGANSDAAAFAAVRADAARRYTVLRAQGQASQALPKDWTVLLKGNAQATDNALIPGEQLGLGGAQAVRGFDERELLGDQGAQLTLELGSPKLLQLLGLLTQGAVADLRAVVFADAGWVGNHGSLACLGTDTHCHAASAGLGLRLSWRTLQARLDVAQALSSGSTTTEGSTRAHFNLAFSF